MRVHQSRECVAALDVPAKLDELPAFAVAHGPVRDALKEVRALLHGTEELVRIEDPAFFRAARDHLQRKFSEVLPHFRAALVAEMAKIFSGGGNTGNDRRNIFAAEDQRFGELQRIETP